jgi:hypothetical protein
MCVSNSTAITLIRSVVAVTAMSAMYPPLVNRTALRSIFVRD